MKLNNLAGLGPDHPVNGSLLQPYSLHPAVNHYNKAGVKILYALKCMLGNLAEPQPDRPVTE